MRFADVIGLSLGALWQQKGRTVMTTMGVVFGAFVLVVSLSLGQGVQETIQRESHRNAYIRRIDIWPEWQAKASDLTPGQIKGEMSEEKRQRLQAAMAQERQRFAVRGPRTPLNAECLRSLANLEHVSAVNPLVEQVLRAGLDGYTEEVQTCSAANDRPFYLQRVVAGSFFQTADEHSAVVSEYFCYRAGIVTDAEVAAVIGKKLRLESRTERPWTGLRVYLAKADADMLKPEETDAIEKLQSQLPSSLDRLELTAGEKATLRTALQRTPPPLPPTVFVHELTIVGVVRQATDADWTDKWDQLNSVADVLLPVGTAEAIAFERPEAAKIGINYVRLEIDQEENVRGVTDEVTDMGLRPHSPLEFIDRERFIYLMIFSTMTIVAGVALLIAALGIANTMLMSVLERTREIGIFKAVGAGDGTVMAIFLIEGALIGLVGGTLGLLAAWGASFPADAWIRSTVSRDLKIELTESLMVFPWWLTTGVVAFAALVTTLAALYPARRAARVEPLKALRHE
jgi:putative ABC transport system permease protein